MPIYEFTQTGISRLEATTFSRAGLRERRDLQRLLRENVEVIAPDSLVIAEEFGEWEDSRRRIDLLAIHQGTNLLGIELERHEERGHIELQSHRYAFMVSKMIFYQAVGHFGRFLQPLGKGGQGPR